MQEVPGKFLFREIDERAGARTLPLLSVSQYRGVVLRSELTDDLPRAEDLSNYKVCTEGDIVVNRMSAYQGAMGQSPKEGVVSPDYMVLRPGPLVESRYLHHLFRSAWFRGEVVQRLRGIGSVDLGNVRTPRINPDEFGSIRLPVPPLEEQRRIADFLDSEIARIDRMTAATSAQQDLVEERESVAFTESVIRAGGPRLQALSLGQHVEWPAMPLNRVLRQLTNGYVGPTRDLFVEEGVPYLQSLHIKHGEIDFARRPYYVSPAWAAERPRIRLGFQDILIVQTGAIGEVGIVGEDFVGASCHALLIARTDRHVLRPRYLWHALRSHWGRQALLREQTGALHPHLEAGNVRFMRFPIPSLSTQDRIVADTEAITRDVRTIQAALGRRMSLQAERRQALITAAVTGQFDVSTASGRNVTEGVAV
ncbi:restriction endonuclease subunit S [Streptomyces sp. NPDC014889]|uniref:restriction endonuclease subunit S n=1 Tax=Streptomyces sp. NPDC014889 TaxID=3364928 RepID=UPI003700466B